MHEVHYIRAKPFSWHQTCLPMLLLEQVTNQGHIKLHTTPHWRQQRHNLRGAAGAFSLHVLTVCWRCLGHSVCGSATAACLDTDPLLMAAGDTPTWEGQMRGAGASETPSTRAWCPTACSSGAMRSPTGLRSTTAACRQALSSGLFSHKRVCLNGRRNGASSSP